MKNKLVVAATDNRGFIVIEPNQFIEISSNNCEGKLKHLFETSDIKAINAAIACNRPLLLTGDPGIGKTQLARAAAIALGRAFVRHTVDAKTEPGDLLWQFDAVARLANAQIAQSMGWDKEKCEEELAAHNYIRPGPLWWGLNWESAAQQPGALLPPLRDAGQPAKGIVVLIDEIDKAEIDVPNGLLEVLGDGRFHPAGLSDAVYAGEIPPLIVLTSNRERALPDAFVRRCIVMKLKLPDQPELHHWLVRRGKAHSNLDGAIIEEAATQLIRDRQAAEDNNHSYLPGQAEFLDLLRTIEKLSGDKYTPHELLEMVSPFILQKGDAL